MSEAKTRVAVLFGGRSAEHEISVITGLEIVGAMDTQRYEAHPVYVAGSGKWYIGEALRKKEFYKRLPESLKEVTEVTLLPCPGRSELQAVSGGQNGPLSFFKGRGKSLFVDVFFPAFHGQFGEDGCIQGLFELADVAYTGCGVLSSAAAMNKYHCKSVLHAHGIPVLPAAVVTKRAVQENLAEARTRLLDTKGLEEYPLFVKPVNLGSSVGISRAEDQPELDAALAKVFQHDSEALVEPCVTNLMKINVSVLEGEEGPETSVVEIPVSSSGVLTYEDKYMRKGGAKKGANRLEGMAGQTRVIDPEDLEQETVAKVKSYAVEAYRILGCCGCVRFDFMLDLDQNALFFNELNPLPGSMAYYLWEKSKPAVLYPDMISRMIEGALRRREDRSALNRDLGFRALS